MYNWAMEIWTMPAGEFTWGLISWCLLLYALWQIKEELNMRRVRRLTKLR